MNMKRFAVLMLALAMCLMTACSGKDLEARVSELEGQIAEKDALIAELETAAAESAETITGLEAQIEHDLEDAETSAANAADATAHIAELEAKISEMESVIAEKDALIAEKDALVAEKDALIAEMETAGADNADMIAQLEAQVAELSAQIEAANYIAQFDGGYVTVEEAMAEYEYIEYMYSMYGYTMDGYEDYIKEDIASTMVEDKIVQFKSAELGLNVPSADEEAELRASADATLQQYIDQYSVNFAAEGVSDEEVLAQTVEFLAENGIDAETLYQQELVFFAADKLFEHVVAEIAVTDEDVKAAYDVKVGEDQIAYAAPSGYENAVLSGERIYWHPEGFRNVRQVLIKFDADQEARYDEITDRIADLEDELAALETAAEETPAEETPAEETAVEEAPVEETAQRTAADITAKIDAANAELDALFAELAPAAEEVAAKFAEGVAIDELIAVYGGDPGSINADGTTNTYTVSAGSTLYDPAFTEAAMSVAEIGGLSEPGRGMYGLYIVYYDSDVTSGAVDFETVKEDIYYETLDIARADAYDAQIAQWVTELNVVYYMENFR